jgi:hypothetical protein
MDEVRAIWRTVAAMKKEGIYTVISPFWGGYMDPIPASWGLGEYTGEGHMWALMYFSEPVKTAYKEWVRVLYTQINPLTGIALKDEPAVALIQIKNEDSVLFWTIGGIKPNHKATIEQAFHAWLVKNMAQFKAHILHGRMKHCRKIMLPVAIWAYLVSGRPHWMPKRTIMLEKQRE